MLGKTCVNHALLDVLQAISWNSNTPDDSWKELAAGKTNSLGRMLGGMKSLKPLTIFRFSFEVELIIFSRSCKFRCSFGRYMCSHPRIL